MTGKFELIELKRTCRPLDRGRISNFSPDILYGMLPIISANWSQWTECLGSCLSSRRRICSEFYGCNGDEYEEKPCPNADELCFQPVFDIISEGIFSLI